MKLVTEAGIDLFAENLPSINEIKDFADFVNSAEKNRIALTEQLEEYVASSSTKTALPAGIGLCIVGKYEEAVKKLKKAGDCIEKYLYLAVAFRNLGSFKEAIESLDKSISQGADKLAVTLEKAATYRHANNPEAAAKELKSCGDAEKTSAEYHYQLGRLQETQGEYAQAMESYEAALELEPEHQKALFHLAYRYDMTGNEEAAIDYYKEIISSKPIYVNALMNLAILYEDKGNFDKASVCIDKVIEAYPNHPRALLYKKDIDSSKTMFFDEVLEKKKSYKHQILETPISDFELSVRSRNCLKKMNLHTLGDLLNITEAELLSYKNFGETSLREIKVILDSKQLHLGMALEEKQFIPPEMDMDDIDGDEEGMQAKPIDDLQLSVRARNCLSNLNLRTIGDLTRKTEAELMGCKNFGVTSLNEIKKNLGQLGLSMRKLEQ